MDNEARVLDVALAEQLGMAEPRFIRANVITPNRDELEAFGGLIETNTNPDPREAAPERPSI
jgi:hydroxymethylpyrimidine/phosphomethylpyrimidine kinase